MFPTDWQELGRNVSKAVAGKNEFEVPFSMVRNRTSFASSTIMKPTNNLLILYAVTLLMDVTQADTPHNCHGCYCCLLSNHKKSVVGCRSHSGSTLFLEFDTSQSVPCTQPRVNEPLELKKTQTKKGM